MTLAGAPDAFLRSVKLRRLIDALEGQWLRRVSAVDSRAYGADGGLATASWLRGFCRLSPCDAARMMGIARGHA
jgi:hypothetical protein